MRGHQSAPVWPWSTSLKPHSCGVLCPFRLLEKCTLPCFLLTTLVFKEFRKSRIQQTLGSGQALFSCLSVKKEKRSEKLNSLSMGDNHSQEQLPGEWKPLLDGRERKKTKTTTTIELYRWIWSSLPLRGKLSKLASAFSTVYVAADVLRRISFE